MANIPFMECIGSVMLLTHLTRPNIVYAVDQVSRSSENLGQEHWKALKHILNCLSTQDLKLRPPIWMGRRRIERLLRRGLRWTPGKQEINIRCRIHAT